MDIGPFDSDSIVCLKQNRSLIQSQLPPEINDCFNVCCRLQKQMMLVNAPNSLGCSLERRFCFYFHGYEETGPYICELTDDIITLPPKGGWEA